MHLEEDERQDIQDILAKIKETEAKTPIEVTEHPDGTVVKIDHIERTVEISKPNGEKIFIDHKKDTVISQKPIPEEDQKENNPVKISKIDFIRKEQKIKQLQEVNTLLKAKQQRTSPEQKAPEKETQNEEQEEIDAFITPPKNDDKILENEPIETFSSASSLVPNNDAHPIVSSSPTNTPANKDVIRFSDLSSFLNSSITYRTTTSFLPYVLTPSKHAFPHACKALIPTSDIERVLNTISTLLHVDDMP